MSVHLFTVSEDHRVRLVSSGAPVSLTVNGSGGGGAVDSVNGATGVVVLTAADVGAATAAQGALADSAVQPGDLATVATTGAYADLSGKPTLGTAAAAATTDFATAAQGAKADTAVQPADLTPYATDADITALIGAAPAALNTLSELADALGDDANFASTVTTALAGKQPLDADLTAIAALVTTAYGRGFLTLADQAALVALLPSYQPLDADLTALAAAGNSATLAATTAAFTTADETKLDGIATGATANATDAQLRDRTTHTGAQAISTVTGLQAALDAKSNVTQTINAQTGTTYTLALTDADKMVTCTNAAAISLTVPPNSSVAFPVGSRVDLARMGAGSLTVVAGSGVTVNATPSLVLRAQYSAATLLKLATDTWLLTGDLT